MKLLRKITDKDILNIDGLSTATPRYTSRAILLNDKNEIAVMYSSSYNLYSLPGGEIESGETKEEAVIREIREETGYDAVVLMELGYVYENRGHRNYTQISNYYVAKTSGHQKETELEPREKKAGMSVAWFPLEEVEVKIGSPKHTTVQRRYIQAKDMAAIAEYKKLNWNCSTRGVSKI